MGQGAGVSVDYAAVRRQSALTLKSEIVQESHFSETTCNSAYVSDVQSLIAKKYLAAIFRENFLTQDRNSW